MKRALLMFVALLGMLSAVPAAAEGLTRIDLVSELEDPAPGQTTRIVLRMSPRNGWHGYWRNPGEAGRPVSIDWSAPQGVSFGQPSWPAPVVMSSAGVVSYVMEGDYDLLIPMTLSRDLKPGASLPVRASLTWFVCSESQCSMEKGDVSMSLRVGEGSTPGSGTEVVKGAVMSLPRGLQTVDAVTSDGVVSITLPLGRDVDVGAIHVFFEGDAVPVTAAQTARRVAGGVVVDVATAKDVQASLLKAVASDGRRSWSFTVRVARGPVVPPAGRSTAQSPAPSTSASVSTSSPSPNSPSRAIASASVSTAIRPDVAASADSMSVVPNATAPSRTGGVWWIVLSAMLGGLLLNLMPCVFPILSIKALALARGSGSSSEARMDAFLYAAGTISMCAGLGIALVVMRSAGMVAGWSFQLQDPRVVAMLLALSLALALNLIGLFEMRGPAFSGRAGGRTSSFGAGLASAFVATPCSGPFMGAALGAAMTLPAVTAVCVFAALGLGMSLPFLAIGFVPAVRRLLPRPGAWMVVFRRILAVPVVLTTVWLGMVLTAQAGPFGLFVAAGACAIVALCLWVVGARQRVGAGSAWVVALPAAFALVGCVLLMPVSVDGASRAMASTSDRMAFDEVRLEALRREGRTVFVDFTAAWCLTCKVNERGALSSSRVREAFGRERVVTMVGDWTDGDPRITRYLARHGRNSIPFYQVYSGHARPVVLPQILTAESLETAVTG